MFFIQNSVTDFYQYCNVSPFFSVQNEYFWSVSKSEEVEHQSCPSLRPAEVQEW